MMKIADFYAHIQVGVLQETTVLHVFIIFSPCCSLGTQPLRHTTLGKGPDPYATALDLRERTRDGGSAVSHWLGEAQCA